MQISADPSHMFLFVLCRFVEPFYRNSFQIRLAAAEELLGANAAMVNFYVYARPLLSPVIASTESTPSTSFSSSHKRRFEMLREVGKSDLQAEILLRKWLIICQSR